MLKLHYLPFFERFYRKWDKLFRAFAEIEFGIVFAAPGWADNSLIRTINCLPIQFEIAITGKKRADKSSVEVDPQSPNIANLSLAMNLKSIQILILQQNIQSLHIVNPFTDFG